ncbi:MAG: hypothetical protein KDA32_09280 [Phycisphaerales bacterium]|nr:hypothetical protein [Phycisphaerales bacterium]
MLRATLAVAACALASGSAFAGLSRAVVFVSDQINDVILRMEDRNGDGDVTDPGEVTIFNDDLDATLGVENTQGIVPLSQRSIISVDNFAPDNAVLMRDLNANGDTREAGERNVWFNGAVPGGYFLTNPASLTRAPNGIFYLLDNNGLDDSSPEAVYAIEDLNQNDVIDANEISTHVLLSPVGTSDFILEFDVAPDGTGYLFDISDPVTILKVDPSGSPMTPILTSTDLFALSGFTMTLSGTLAEMTFLPSNEIVVGGFRGNSVVILALKDRNNSGAIDQLNEFRVMWDEDLHAAGFNTGSPRDLSYLASDGSLFWTDGLSDRIWRLVDRNQDDDYNDPNETLIYYDSADFTGQLSATLMQTIATLTACPADLTDDGTVDLADLAALLANFGLPAGPAEGDTTGDGLVDLADLAELLSAFGTDCPPVTRA